MTERSVGVIMNGVTGRMGRVQHLERSIMAIRQEGGVPLPDGTRLMPEPVLVGRDAGRLRALAAEHGLERWSTDLDACLGDPGLPIYFDTQSTERRAGSVRAAIAAGKHVYCEKPLAADLTTALDLAGRGQAPAAAALAALDGGDEDGFCRLLEPTLPLARHVFSVPTPYYKVGVVFLAYLNGHQTHFRMLGGLESARSIVHLARTLVLADQADLLVDPDLAAHRMRPLLALAGC